MSDQTQNNTLNVDGDMIPKYFGSIIPYKSSPITTSTRNKYYRDNNLTYEELDDLIHNDVCCDITTNRSHNRNSISLLICKVNAIKSMVLDDKEIDENYMKFQETASHIKGETDVKFLKIAKSNKKYYFVAINYIILNYQNNFTGENVDTSNGYGYSYGYGYGRQQSKNTFPSSILMSYSNDQNFKDIKVALFKNRSMETIYKELDQIFDLTGANFKITKSVKPTVTNTKPAKKGKKTISDSESESDSEEEEYLDTPKKKTTKKDDNLVSIIEDSVKGGEKEEGEKEEENEEEEPKMPNDPEIEISVKLALLIYYNYGQHMSGGQYSSYGQPISTYTSSFQQIYDFKGLFKEIYNYFNEYTTNIESKAIGLVGDDKHIFHSSIRISKYQRLYFTNHKWDHIGYHDVMPVSNIIRSHIKYDKCILSGSLFYIDKNIKNMSLDESRRHEVKNMETVNGKNDLREYLSKFDIIGDGNSTGIIKFAVKFGRYWNNGYEKEYISINKYINLNVYNELFQKGSIRHDNKSLNEYRTLIKLYSFVRTSEQAQRKYTFNEMKLLEDRGHDIEGEIMKYSYDIVNYKFLEDSRDGVNNFIEEHVNIPDDEPYSMKNNIVASKLFKHHKHHIAVDDKKFSKINMKLFGYQKQNVLWMEDIEDRIIAGKFTFNFNVYHDHKYLKDKHASGLDNKNPYIYMMKFKDEKYVIDTNYLDQDIVDNVYNKYYKKDKDGNFSLTAKKFPIRLAADPQNPGVVAELNKFTGIHMWKYSDYMKQKVKKIPLQGGFLCDEVGLGKTLSTVSHIVNRIDVDKELYKKGKFEGNTLIILPPRLIAQWVFEIEKYLVNKKDLKVLKIMTITDIKKMHKKIPSAKDINKYDIFIISSNLLINEKYTAFLEGRDIVTNAQKKAAKTKVTTAPVKKDKKSKKDDKPKTEEEKKKEAEEAKKAEEEAKKKAEEKKKRDEAAKKEAEKHYKFNIYKIKWNRIVIDEAHELLRGDIDIPKAYGYKDYYKYYDASKKLKKELRELAEIIRDGFTTNFKWCLTATPFEHGPINFANHVQYLIDKRAINECDVHFPILPLSFTSLTEADKMYNNCFKQTLKKEVREEIDIPLFSEKIVWINQSNIERNIYNSYKSRMNINDPTDRKILFQICTNICITNEITEQLTELNVETLTLTDLNKIMIKKFSGQIQKNNKVIKDKTAEIDQSNVMLKKYLYAFEYLKKNNNFNQYKGYMKDQTHRFFEYEQNLRQQGTQFQELLAIIESSIAVMNEDKEMIDLIKTCKSGTYQFGYYLKFQNMNDTDKTYFMYKLFMRQKNYLNSNVNDRKETIKKMEYNNERLKNQVKLFESNDFIKEKVEDPCSICFGDFEDEVVITKCRHVFCGECFSIMAANKTSFPCPECRQEINSKNINKTNMDNINQELSAEPEKPNGIENITKNPNDKDIKLFSKNPELKNECINKFGSKMAYLIEYLQALFEDNDNRVIIFSQYDRMLTLIGKTLDEYGIKNVFCKGQVHHVNKRIDMFKRDASYRVIMLSSEKANSGSNLTEASQIILVDVLNADKDRVKDIETQAIGRAVRLGQKKAVTVTRLITKNTIESEWHERNKYDILEMQQDTPSKDTNDSDNDPLKPKKKTATKA